MRVQKKESDIALSSCLTASNLTSNSPLIPCLHSILNATKPKIWNQSAVERILAKAGNFRKLGRKKIGSSILSTKRRLNCFLSVAIIVSGEAVERSL